MKNLHVLFLIVFMLILSACASRADVTPTPTPALVKPVIMDTPTPVSSCSAISVEPTVAPSLDSYFPPVTAGDFSVGPADAPVTIVEYCEFQSDSCLNMAGIIGKLMSEHKDVRFVFRPLPLIGVLDKSEQAVLAALAADEQGQFWLMYDLLFAKHAEWKSLKPAAFDAWVLREAAALEMDEEKLKTAMKAEETATSLQEMYESAKKLSIPAVPLILINGNLQPSYLLDYQSVSDAVGLFALGRKQFTQCPPFNVNPQSQYIVTLHTEKGDIVMQLFPDKAPLAVNSFVFLAKQGWYNGVTFHRVVPGFLAQSGDPSGTGRGNPGYFFKNEDNDLKFDKPGMVAMSNNGLDTNGSQFFITFAPAPQLDGGYTIFGQVLNGLDVAEKLMPRDPGSGQALSPGDKILSVEVEEK
ncbi:putative peptidyl-prolyl cis-trans isomerase [Anaerolineales bacterium]|nr:putative peptidyl-prolyl cis-trans isomerase [Anaerolineales bacterium]